MKGLTWKQRQDVLKQLKVEKATANATVGSVCLPDGLNVCGCPCIGTKAATKRTAVSIPNASCNGTSLPDAVPAVHAASFTRSVHPAASHTDGCVCSSTIPLLREYGIRRGTAGLQNDMRNNASPFTPAILGMQIPDQFNASYPPLLSLHPVQAYHHAKRIRTASQEVPTLISRPSKVGVIPSVKDLEPLPPSAGLRSYSVRQQHLTGVKERELRKIQYLQDKIALASMNVVRLMDDLSFVNGQVLAAKPNLGDYTLPQIPRDIDCEDFSALPFANAADDITASLLTPIVSTPATTRTVTTATKTIPLSMLICSPKEDDAIN